MSNTNNSLKGKINTNTIIGLGLLTAIVVVMQFISMGLRVGTFSITLTLIPIVVGSALYGWGSGAWLGFVFGVTVLPVPCGKHTRNDNYGNIKGHTRRCRRRFCV